jgi:putative ABC transport system ATP-binding protein
LSRSDAIKKGGARHRYGNHRGRQVMELFAKVAHERSAAVLVVTHDQCSLDVFDWTVQMEDGQLKPEGHEKS